MEDINENIRKFAEKEKIDLERVFKYLNSKCLRSVVLFPRSVVLKNQKINGVQYKELIFSKAVVYSKEKVPPNCLHLPKIYKTSILGYDPGEKTALIFVKKIGGKTRE